MSNEPPWIDLLDPTTEELEQHLPDDIHDSALTRLLAPVRDGDEPRPRLESHGDYAFGVFLVPTADKDTGVVGYQEVDVVMTHDRVVTVRKSPAEGDLHPYDSSAAREACRGERNPAAIVYHLVDDVAERFLDLIDSLDEAIDELEDQVEQLPPARIRDRLSQFRHDILHIRRVLSPTRDAVRRVLDNRVELRGQEFFTRDVELSFADAYDKLLRASDGLELSRDLAAGVRDYLQARIANDQNEVMKRLTMIASLLLVPTFIVGVYGQNFRVIPELHWGFGYAWSWGLIVLTTLVQLWYFRRKRWL